MLLSKAHLVLLFAFLSAAALAKPIGKDAAEKAATAAAAKPESKPDAANSSTATAHSPAPVSRSGTQAPNVAAKSYLLLDTQSSQVLASQKADDRVEPASLTKLMTAYLTFSALRQKKLDINQTVPVSQKAWKAEGSRMFIEPNRPVTVEELLRGMIIQSGNDASVALAEAVAGSEDAFAELMNKEAKKLGMSGTHYTNSTGLPGAQHYTTASDLSRIASAIISDFPDYYKYYSTKEYRYNNITQPNRNRLLWLDPSVDGMKTGHTENAGYCLITSAKRENRRLISVILGAASDNARTNESQKLLGYGFQFFETNRLHEKGAALKTLPIYKGQANEVRAGLSREVYIALPKGDFGRHKESLTTTQPLLAPIESGQKLGTLEVSIDGKTIGEYPVVALENVPLAGFFGRTWDSFRLLWQ